MHLPVVLLIIAVLTRILSSWFPSLTVSIPSRPRRKPCIVKVLIACSSSDSWYDVATHIILQATDPRSLRICFVVECQSANDASIDYDVDDHLRSTVTVMHTKAKRPFHQSNRLKRLARRFVNGDETAIVCAGIDVQLVRGWDDLCLCLMKEIESPLFILSCAPPNPFGVATFPVLTTSESGTVRRGTPHPFAKTDAITSTASVCWCPEFTLTTPQTLERVGDWVPSTTGQTAIFKKQRITLLVPSCALIESTVATQNDGNDDASLTVNRFERIGLSTDAPDDEKIMKFGSCRRANLALKF